MKNLIRNSGRKRILILDGGGQLGAFQWGVMTEF